MRGDRPTWTVAEVAERTGHSESMAAEYLDDYRKLGMARRVDGRWWLRANARRALTFTAPPSAPRISDPVWLGDTDEPYDRRPGGWVRWSEDTGWTRKKRGYIEWFRVVQDDPEKAA